MPPAHWTKLRKICAAVNKEKSCGRVSRSPKNAIFMWQRQRHEKAVILYRFFHPAEFSALLSLPPQKTKSKTMRSKLYLDSRLKNPLKIQKTVVFSRKQPFFMVRVARLELAASWSQTRRPTNWATPGYAIARRRITARPLFYTTAAGLSTTFV